MEVISTISKIDLKLEDELILCCARTNIDEKTRKRIKSILMEDLNWVYLLCSASRHRLKLLLYWHLHRFFNDDIPKKIMKDLNDYFYLNSQKNLLMLGELINILNLFESHQILSLPYKGPILAIDAYNSLLLREFNDLDIFIKSEDVSKTIDVLIQEGYKSLFNSSKEQIKAHIKYGRDLPFKTQNNINLEIQWTFIHLIFSMENKFEFSDYSKHTKKLYVSNNKIETFNNNDLILIISAHNASHYWGALSMICDISEIIKSDPSLKWSQIVKNAELIDMKRILFVNLILSKELFGLKLPETVLELINLDKASNTISNKVIKMFFANEKLKNKDKIIFHLTLREKFINKIKDLSVFVLLPSQNIIDHLWLPKYFFSIYRLIRILEFLYNLIMNPLKR